MRWLWCVRRAVQLCFVSLEIGADQTPHVSLVAHAQATAEKAGIIFATEDASEKLVVESDLGIIEVSDELRICSQAMYVFSRARLPVVLPAERNAASAPGDGSQTAGAA
jgi:hypothetical protein